MAASFLLKYCIFSIKLYNYNCILNKNWLISSFYQLHILFFWCLLSSRCKYCSFSNTFKCKCTLFYLYFVSFTCCTRECCSLVIHLKKMTLHDHIMLHNVTLISRWRSKNQFWSNFSSLNQYYVKVCSYMTKIQFCYLSAFSQGIGLLEVAFVTVCEYNYFS